MTPATGRLEDRRHRVVVLSDTARLAVVHSREASLGRRGEATGRVVGRHLVAWVQPLLAGVVVTEDGPALPPDRRRLLRALEAACPRLRCTAQMQAR